MAQILTRRSQMPPLLRHYLPPHVLAPLERVEGRWEELHLRVGRCASVTVGGENRRVDCTLREDEAKALIHRLCGGSMYAHRESINQGYICLPDGVRVGLCGTAALDGDEGQLLGVHTPDAICIRFPQPHRACGEGISSRLTAYFPRGALFYAPPGVGKTTLLRALARHFAGGERPLRVAVVDSRGELNDGSFDGRLCLSLLTGYPKGRGIEIAVRSLNAQLLICDEIGNAEEASSILAVAGCGVPLLASAHAANCQQLLSRPALRALHEAAVFGCYVGLSRQAGQTDFAYHLTEWSQVTYDG